MTRRMVPAALIVACLMSVPSMAEEVKPADLATERLEAARETFKGIVERLKINPNFHASGEMLYLWSRRWMEAEQALATDKAGKTAALRGHVERMRKLEAAAAEGRKQGMVPAYEVSQTRYYRIEAEMWLAAVK